MVGLRPDGDPAVRRAPATALDALLVVGPGGVTLTGRPDAGGGPLDRPLDPLTPVDVVDGAAARASPSAAPRSAALLRRDAGLLAAALQVGLAEAAVAMATGYAK